jgi:tetratricopeptide (TPR) repeat protein
VVAPGDSQAAGDAGDAAKTETQDTGVAEVSGRDEGIEPIHHGIIENQLLIEVAEEVPAGAEELGNLATSQQESSESAAVEVIGVKAQDAGGEGLPSARSFFDTSEATRVIAGLEAALTGEAGADAGLGGVSGTESPVDHGDVVRIAPPGEGPAQTAFRAQSHAAARGGDVEPSARRGDGASGGTEAVGGAGLLPSGSHLKDPDGWPSARLILGPPGLSPMERPRGRTHEGKAGGRGQTSGSENAAGVRSGGKGATVHGTKAAGGAKFQAPSDRKRRVAVSVASGPRVMELPRWFAAPVALLCWLVVMPVLCWVCWAWVQDAQRANEILSQVRAAGLSSGGTELDLSGGETAWWRTRPEHLVWRAMALDRSAGDARTLEEVDFLLTAALQSAPGDPAARAASVARRMRSLPTNARMLDVRLVGLSRDAWPMVETAGRLARAGQVDPAIEAYHRAFELLLRDPTLPWQEPFFLEGGAERFALPREREARGLVDRLADDRGITFARWSTILPSDGAMWLAAYAVLKERGRAEAQSALQTILGLELREDRERAAVVLAAKAEASVALGKWHEAIEKYEKAIQHQPDAAIRRSWSYNKARIHARLGQRAECEQAWLEARGSTGQDALSRLVDRGMARLGFGGQDPGRGEGNRAAGVPGAATGKAGSRDGIIDRSENRGRER